MDMQLLSKLIEHLKLEFVYLESVENFFRVLYFLSKFLVYLFDDIQSELHQKGAEKTLKNH